MKYAKRDIAMCLYLCKQQIKLFVWVKSWSSSNLRQITVKLKRCRLVVADERTSTDGSNEPNYIETSHKVGLLIESFRRGGECV